MTKRIALTAREASVLMRAAKTGADGPWSEWIDSGEHTEMGLSKSDYNLLYRVLQMMTVRLNSKDHLPDNDPLLEVIED